MKAVPYFSRKSFCKQVEIMPCHAFGKSKYAALGKPYPNVQQYTPEGLKAAEERFARHGLVPVIV